jgi:predicted metal-dependent phosphoesterase TrpH
MAFFLADLHIHTVLSACAEVEMLPELIVEQAQALGLSIIAVTDHNSAENVAAVFNAACGTGIAVLPGMELQTREEVHLICLFDALEQVTRWQARVYDCLPSLKNDEDAFGTQVVLGPDGEIAGTNDRLLLTAASLSVEKAVREVHELGGLCIPAHIDRPAFRWKRLFVRCTNWVACVSLLTLIDPPIVSLLIWGLSLRI